MKKILIFCLVYLITFSFIPISSVKAAGASLYIAPGAGTYVIGSTFTVSVKVNTGGQVINAAEGSMSYDTNLLDVVSVSRSGAVFNLWTTEPTAGGGSIRFGGGIPMPGYNGSAGHVCNITFKAKQAGDASVRFTSGAVLANDGKGTNILASMGAASYKISPKVEAPKQDTSSQTKTETKTTTPKVEEPKPEPEYNKPNITSDTHPDQNKWSNKDDVTFKWEMAENITGVSFAFDENPTTIPGNVSDGEFNEKTFEDVDDGIMYFHLKLKDSRKWGTTAHYRVMLDTTPPDSFEIETEEGEVGSWPILHYKSDDKGSGLLKYEIFIGSLEEQSHEKEPEENTLQLFDLSAGEHTAMIKAIDKAGNERVQTIVFYIDPIPTPEIINYPSELDVNDKFYLNGTAMEDVTINVNIEKNSNIIITSAVTSDAEGKWFYIADKDLSNGRYVVWVEAVNENGIKSNPSEKVSFLVSPPIFMTVGNFVINYFTLIVSLLFMIILIVILIVFLIGLIRRKLKKETIEIEEVLHKNIKELQKEVDKDFEDLSQFEGKTTYKTKKTETIGKIKAKIDNTEKNIMKEVKDVEEILK